jgi:hypothetical protein
MIAATLAIIRILCRGYGLCYLFAVAKTAWSGHELDRQPSRGDARCWW